MPDQFHNITLATIDHHIRVLSKEESVALLEKLLTGINTRLEALKALAPAA